MPIESATLSTQRASSPPPEPSEKMVCLSQEGAAASSPGRPSWPSCAASWPPSWPVCGALAWGIFCATRQTLAVKSFLFSTF